jgi:hypothetical protein
MTPSGRHCWRERPRAYASGSACKPGRCCAGGKAELVAQIRQTLGEDRFDEMFTAGTQLNRRQARAAALGRHGPGTAAS